jgi:putative FmdB family regulatory protein
MPNYSYECLKCKKHFELFFYIKDYTDNPQCVYCKSKKTNRLYVLDVATQSTSVKKSDSELKTLGDLANRNRDKMTDDQKNELYHKHNEYKYSDDNTTLPKGMSKIKKPNKKTKWH